MMASVIRELGAQDDIADSHLNPSGSPKVLMFDASTKGTPKRAGPAASPTCAPVSNGLDCQPPKSRDVSILGPKSQHASKTLYDQKDINKNNELQKQHHS